jgi:hypothetical protein
MDPRLPIRSLDYTVTFARNLAATREFYGTTLGSRCIGSSARNGWSFGSGRTSWR